MPEGHTIHRRARDHRAWFAGQPASSCSPQGRFGDADALDGLELTDVEAFGKHLLYRFEGDLTVHVHLGLFGRFRTYRGVGPPPRGQVRWRIANESRTVDLSGPTACERLDPPGERALLARLGPDPLREPARSTAPESLWRALQRRRTPIAAALLDQALIAGLGNVYRAELLHRAQIDPYLPANQLPRPQLDAIWSDAQALLAIGVRLDRIVAVDSPSPSKLRRAERLSVYRRSTCLRCDTPVSRANLSGRTLYWCSTCQPAR